MIRGLVLLFALGCFVVLVFCLVKLLKGDAVGTRLSEIENDGLSGPSPAFEASKADSKEQKKLNLHVPDKVKADIAESGLMMRVDEFVLMWVSLTFIPPIISFVIMENPFVSLCLVLVGAFIPPWYIGYLKKKRRETFGVQLGDALMLISNGLRAGFSFEQVMESVQRDMSDPIAQEFGRSVREMRLGVSMEDSLTALADRTKSVDMQLLTSAVVVQRKVGGNLADILDNLSETIRERVRLKGRIRTLTAQGRISGYIIGVLPVVLFFVISGINPSYMEIFRTTTLGVVMLVVAALMEIVAFLIIRKMVAL